MDKRLIYGVLINDRLAKAAEVQALLTEYGCCIRTRLGLHHVEGGACEKTGLLILEMFGEEAKCRELGEKLAALEGVEVQKMEFCC